MNPLRIPIANNIFIPIIK